MAFLMLVAAVVFLVIVLIAALAVRARRRAYTRPKAYSPPRALPPGTKGRSCEDPTRDAFKPKKVPPELDYVIVGSGMGGLYCAALLAKSGKRVLVVEQHYVAGGCTHSFHDGGFEFDTGLHYVGRIEKYRLLFDLVTGKGCKKIEWAQMGSEGDGFCYDEIQLGSEPPFRFCAGETAFVSNLVRAFPAQRTAIEEYVRLCKRVNKIADMYFYCKLFHPALQWVLNRVLNAEYFEWAGKTTWEVVSSLTDDPKLRSILCGQYGNYGLTPQSSSFLIQAGITAHYMGGAYYPIGGSQVISEALIPTIEQAGGRVLIRGKATAVEIDDRGHAVGVRVQAVNLSGLAEGDETVIRSRQGVISGIGAVLTQKLVPESHRAKLGYAPMLRDVKPSVSHVYAFVGLRGTTEELGLRCANLWVLPCDETYSFVGTALDDSDKKLEEEGSDPWKHVGNDESKEDMLLFMGFPSVKDPSFAARFPGKATCEIISTAHPEWFKTFVTDNANGCFRGNPNQSGKRVNEQYAAIKKGLEAKLIRALHRHYPKTRGKVEFVSIGTPLTNEYYLGRADSYGLEHTPKRYAGALDNMRPQTAIPGLFVTGQDVGTVGIVGALNGGILTAHACMGYGFWELVVAKRNLIEDLLAMEDNGGDKKKS